MSYIVWIIIIGMIIRFLFTFTDRRNRNSCLMVEDHHHQRVAARDPEETEQLRLPTHFPWRERWQRFRELRGNNRKLEKEEVFSNHIDETGEIIIHLPVSRNVARIKVSVNNQNVLVLRDVRLELDGEVVEVPMSIRQVPHRGKTTLEIDLGGIPQLDRVVLMLGENGWEGEGEIDLIVRDDAAPDLSMIQSSWRAIQNQDWNWAHKLLRRYEEYSTENPLIALWLGQVQLRRKDFEDAAAQGIRTMLLGFKPAGEDIYNKAKSDLAWHLDNETIDSFRAEAASWELPRHHGIVTLLTRYSFRVGLNGYHRERYHELVEIRRRAAARRFRTVSVSLDAQRTSILFSAVRIIHVDGSVDELPLDRFVKGDAEDDNMFITIDRRENASWILPDLAVGDVVEYTYELLRRDRGSEKETDGLLTAPLAVLGQPTLHGEVEIVSPLAWQMNFVTRNSEADADIEEDTECRLRHARWKIQRRQPYIISGYPYQSQYLSPLVAGCRAGQNWSEVAEKLAQREVPGDLAEIPFPRELADLVDGIADRQAALARIFYWVRDRIKYGSLRSGNDLVHDKNRIGALMEGRIGDCKDKTYLLALACHHLEIPCEQVLVSSRNGLIVADLPCDQFDHVLLRARPHGEWVYLDAAGEKNTFGNVPIGLQGLQGLVLGDHGRLVDLPEDSIDHNRLEISETIEMHDDTWLTSEVEINITGTLGRFFDEQWKWESLTKTNEIRALENAVAMITPGVAVEEFEKLADTGSGDICRLRFRCRRSRLAQLGGRRIGMCRISVPNLSAAGFHEQELGDEFMFHFCQSVTWRLTVIGEAVRAFKGFSLLTGDTFAFADIDQEMASIENGSSGSRPTTLIRNLEVQRRLIAGDDVDSLTRFFDDFEEFRRVVLEFVN